jgi:hypothetical protein
MLSGGWPPASRQHSESVAYRLLAIGAEPFLGVVVESGGRLAAHWRVAYGSASG